MPLYSHISFEGKHIDEKVLHIARPARIQTVYEMIRVGLPALVTIILLIILFSYQIIALSTLWIVTGGILLFLIITLSYKLYRVRRNYLYITSKRVLFHGIEGLFRDYVKKITLDNIRNVNYFTEHVVGKIAGYGTLEIQSSHDGMSNIIVYHIPHGKLLTHYIDKIISLSPDDRAQFPEFDPDYFRK